MHFKEEAANFANEHEKNPQKSAAFAAFAAFAAKIGQPPPNPKDPTNFIERQNGEKNRKERV